MIKHVELRTGNNIEVLTDVLLVSIEQQQNSRLHKLTVARTPPESNPVWHTYEPVELLRSNGTEWHFVYLAIDSGTGIAPGATLIVLS